MGTDDFATVTAVQNEDGFRKMRAQLAADYRLSDKLPDITFHDYQVKTDRCLVLRHHVKDYMLLDIDDTKAVLEYMHSQWEHPVVIESVSEDGEVLEVFSSPPNYDYKAQKVLTPPKPIQPGLF